MEGFYKNEVNRLDQEAMKDQKRVDQDKSDLIKKIKMIDVELLAEKEFLNNKSFFGKIKNKITNFFNKF